ncbi:hypothetical protein HA466_0224100 [Hirschfeldia incana]|nr:hypothetical protein HA466_0224100 [Hirschfeldia incana]KAJ0240841.1 hypothetical protein HA466_0224100 [Hirschfeldia incana]
MIQASLILTFQKSLMIIKKTNYSTLDSLELSSSTETLGVYLIEHSSRSRGSNGSNKCECGRLNRMWLTRER